MVVSIWAGTTGQLDSVAVQDIRRFESEFLEYIGRSHKGIFDVIAETKELTDDTVAKLTAAVNAFKSEFKSSVAKPVNEAEAEAQGSDGSEQITRYKK
jgi:F-type H+-transporting ATPase subunit alpha